MNTTIPYTYLIGWSSIDKWYYGVRYKTGCCPSDLWTKYFTSSILVAEYRKIYGEPDIIRVRKTFNDIDAARDWEVRVLQKMNVVHQDKWLNQNDSKAIRLSPETLRKIVEKRGSYRGENNSFYGKRHSEKTKEILRKKAKERGTTDEIKDMLRTKWVGKKRSAANKIKVSEYAKSRIWIVNKEGVLRHCNSLQDPRLLSGEFKLGKKWVD